MYDEERRIREERVDDPTRPIGYRREEEIITSGRGMPPREVIANRVSQVVWTIIGLLEALLAFRVLLKLIGANANNGFVDFIYGFSDFFAKPFYGIVNDPTSGDSVLEINTLIAMLVYLVLGWAVIRIVWLIYDVTAPTKPGV